jgi:hypothetical protein
VSRRTCHSRKRRRRIEELEGFVRRSLVEQHTRSPPDFSVFDFDEEDSVQHSSDVTEAEQDKSPGVVSCQYDSDQEEGTQANQPSGRAVVQCGTDQQEEIEVRYEKLKQFSDFCKESQIHRKAFQSDLRAAVELSSILIKSGGSLELYDKLMNWHTQNISAVKGMSQNKMKDELTERYQMQAAYPTEVPVYLPHAKETVNVTTFDCYSQVVHLLSDPRWCDDDFLFFDDDPLSGPPQEFLFLNDVNSGKAYRETYKEMIGDNPMTSCGRRKVPLGFIFYVDGCVTGQFNNLSIEILKFTVSVLNSKARSKHHAWKRLGFVPNQVKDKGKVDGMIKQSNHVDAGKYVKDPKHRSFVTNQGSTEPIKPNFGRRKEMESDDPPAIPELKAQDYHVVMDAIMGSYGELERNGFDWDQRYKGVTWPLRFLPFILYFVVDGAAADKLTGQFGVKTGNVACLCRTCECPTTSSNLAYARYNLKTKPNIEDLVRKGEVEELRKISQHPIWNAFYQFRFPSHSDQGIHGACPMEPLHWINLNDFGYTRESFFEQCGKESDLAGAINKTATMVSTLLQRQSDKDLSRTQFSKSIQEGKVMAHEMPGLIMVLLVTIRSTRGRNELLNLCHGDKKITSRMSSV